MMSFRGKIVDGFSDCVSEDNCGLNLKSFQCSLICVIHDLCPSAETATRDLVLPNLAMAVLFAPPKTQSIYRRYWASTAK